MAALNGPSPAAGCLLALAADYRIKGSDPKFVTGLNETALGFAAPKWLADTFIDQVGRREAYLALNLSTLYRPVRKTPVIKRIFWLKIWHVAGTS